jgi:hypothetical protein
MRDRSNLHQWTLIVIALALAVFVAFLAAGRSDGEFGDVRNDTFGYEEHFKCLGRGGSIGECNPTISVNATEYIYPAAVAIIAKTLGPQCLYVFKFGIALVIGFVILFGCASLSKVPSLTLMVLVLDFRFWEYVANSLRNGMAVAVFILLFAFYKHREKPIPWLAKLLPGLAHSGALILALAPRRKLGIKFAILLGLACLLAVGSVNYWLPLLSSGGLGTEKLAYYALAAGDDSAGFALPVHYLALFALMAYSYAKSDDQLFIQMCNVLLVLLVFAVLLSFINLSYRAISLMLPFLAVGLSYPLDAWRRRLWKRRDRVVDGERDGRFVSAAGFSFAYLTVLGLFVAAFIRNFELVQIHLA